ADRSPRREQRENESSRLPFSPPISCRGTQVSSFFISRTQKISPRRRVLLIHLVHHPPPEAHRGGTFYARAPQAARPLSLPRQRLRRRGNHRHADPDIRLLAESEWAERQNPPVGLPKNLEARVRQGIEHDADLHADRFLLHQRSEMLRLGAGQPPAFAPHGF